MEQSSAFSVADTPEEPPARLYRRYLQRAVRQVRQADIFPYLRDRDTDPLDAGQEIADFMDRLSRQFGQENPVFAAAYEQLPMFREWLIEDVFDGVYNDIPQRGDELSRSLGKPDRPEWARGAGLPQNEEQESPNVHEEHLKLLDEAIKEGGGRETIAHVLARETIAHHARSAESRKEPAASDAKTENLPGVISRYSSRDEVIVIMQYPNGKFYTHYGYDEENDHSDSIAGGFDTFEHAEKAMYAHRPTAERLAEPGSKKVSPDSQTLSDLAERYNELYKSFDYYGYLDAMEVDQTEGKMIEQLEETLVNNLSGVYAFWDEALTDGLVDDDIPLKTDIQAFLDDLRMYADAHGIAYTQAAEPESTEVQQGQEPSDEEKAAYKVIFESVKQELSERGITMPDVILDEYVSEDLISSPFYNIKELADFAESQYEPPEGIQRLVGQELTLDDRRFVVDSINELFDTVSLRDITFEGNTGFPIFRVENLAYIQDLIEHPEKQKLAPRNFHITNDSLGHGGPKTKYGYNIAAIRTLKQIEQEKRQATPEEQEVLHRYVGWGGIPQAFDERHDSWSKEYAELKKLLTEKEYSSAVASTLNAHYTSPVVIRAIYQALENLGFQGGTILDPGCGVGNFQGMMPESMQDSKVIGIELDSITGRIARQLYPENDIRIEGFEKSQLPDSYFDVAFGNVPFGSFKLAEKRYDRHNFLIHDHFFAKALDKVRPGGIIAFISSKGTLDKQNPQVRKYIAQWADLLGAIRLPNTTFRDNANTEVTSDIIFLQKRDRAMEIEPEWVHLGQTLDGIPVNSYFAEHPEMVLGTMVFSKDMYGKETDTACLPLPSTDLQTQLAEAIQHIHGQITDYEREEADEDLSIPADPDVRNFSFALVNGQVYYRENSRMRPAELSKTATERAKSLIGLRDCVRNLIGLQQQDAPPDDIAQEQARLNALYDHFVRKHGRINSRGNSMAFSEDSSYYLLCSLEINDDDGNFLRKADMFTKRTIQPTVAVTHCDTAQEALIVSIGEHAAVDLPFMAALTDLSEEQIITDLRGVIFRDLGSITEDTDLTDYNLKTKSFVTADAYLSGNVRKKLKTVQTLLAARPDLTAELAGYELALTKVQPKDLSASEISVRLGTTWIPVDVYQQFMHELFGTRRTEEIRLYYNTTISEWSISHKNIEYDNVRVTKTFGTRRLNGYTLFEKTLNLRDAKIYDKMTDVDGTEKSVLNVKETMLAQAQQEKLKTEFLNWIWKDPDRRQRLTAYYNEHLNNIRPREYDGSHIQFHGMNPEITLRKHQANAVARGLYGGNTLLAHEVGAGKTYVMIALAMEKKRLGLCAKSLIVVPNHIIEQFAADWLRLYPGANILVSSKKDFEAKNRKKFVARIATGDYDAIIIGHSQFEKIPISIERQQRLIDDQIFEISIGIEQAKENDGEYFTIKQLERLKKSLESRLEKLNDRSRKDDVITFEETGIDQIMVDEAHSYKNLFLATKMRNVGGISQTDAQKSSDLFAKCRYLDDLTGSKGITFATGTPISNSMVEMYTMQRYLQYALLEERNLHHFDEWATVYGETVTAMELAPEGKGFRMKTRFSKFYNLPDLMMLFRECADIQTSDMMNLPVPKAEYHIIDLPPSDYQKELVSALAERAEAIRSGTVDPAKDNMLLITNEGRKAALDQRLMNPLLPDNPQSKTNACAENVYRIWNETMENRSTQLVFCDLSTPVKIPMVEQPDGSYAMDTAFYDVYHDLEQKLMDKGVPEDEIAFIHDYNTDAQKKELFSKVNSGVIRVLIGSTQKMGAGTNCQQRLIALHDLDCPYRPSDLTQRSGRIIRQGNDNGLVHIFRYITKETFDAYMWQMVERKQRFISQIMTSKSISRTMEDVDDVVLSYAEIKALATGDPRMMEWSTLDAETSKLRVLQAGFLSQRYDLEDMIRRIPKQMKRQQEEISTIKREMELLAAQPVPPEGKIHPITILGVMYTERKEAGAALTEAIKKVDPDKPLQVGEYRGYAMHLSFSAIGKAFVVTLTGIREHSTELGEDPIGNFSRIQNVLSGFDKELLREEKHLVSLRNKLEQAKTEVSAESPYEMELKEKTVRLNELVIALNLDKKDPVLDRDTEEQPEADTAPARGNER